jgi:hypothetical protein
MLIQKFVSDKTIVGTKDTWQEMSDGRLIVPVTLTRTGVFKYRYSEIFGNKEHPDYPKSMFKDGIINVYRSKDEVLADKSLNSMRGMFFTDEHPETEVTTENHTEFDKGSFSTDITTREEKYNDYSLFFVDSFLTMKDAATIKLFKSGAKNQISLGYTAFYKYNPGTFAGMTYDFEQVDIENNHGALVKYGRAGSLVKIKSRTGDLDTVYQIEDSENIINNEEKKFIMDLRGVKIEFKDSNSEVLIEQELQTKDNQIKGLETEIENKQKVVDSARAENLKLSTELEKLRSVDHEALAEERGIVIEKAKVYLKDTDFKGKNIDQIKEMAVREAYKHKDLSDITPGFITDSFRLLDDKPSSPQPKQTIKDSFNGVKPVQTNDEDSEINEMVQSISNAYKGVTK